MVAAWFIFELPDSVSKFSASDLRSGFKSRQMSCCDSPSLGIGGEIAFARIGFASPSLVQSAQSFCPLDQDF